MKTKYKLLHFLPAVCIMTGIFYFSSQTAVQSSGLSSNITEELIKGISHFFNIQEDTAIGTAFFHIIEILVRKSAHMAEYGVLAVTIAYPLSKLKIQGIRFIDLLWRK